MSTDLKPIVERELDHIVAIRRDLHRHPELQFDLPYTSGVVQRELTALGIEHRAGLAGGCGVLGLLPATGGGNGAKAVALRADMDALPILEQTGLEYESENEGRMHACGHDGHTAILLGAARVLSRIDRPRPVLLVFQPAEEGGAGGKRMCEDGVLDGTVIGPPVERIFGLHGWPLDDLGRVSTRSGPLLAAADEFDATIHGVQAHAAWPHGSRDPIVAGAACVGALQTIVSRNTDPLESIVITVGALHAGTAHNIIPAEAVMSGTLRTLSEEMRSWAKGRIDEVIERTAHAYGCRAEIAWEPNGYPVTFNHADATERFFDVARRTLNADAVGVMERPVMGGEDFAFYSQRVSACFFTLGLRPEGVADPALLHTPGFNFNDDAIPTGVELMCRLALEG
jgi:amidohydrolase